MCHNAVAGVVVAQCGALRVSSSHNAANKATTLLEMRRTSSVVVVYNAANSATTLEVRRISRVVVASSVWRTSSVVVAQCVTRGQCGELVRRPSNVVVDHTVTSIESGLQNKVKKFSFRSHSNTF